MFDDSFQRSKVYFTVLETLRVSGDWIRDSLKSWDSLREQWSRDVKPERLFSQPDLVAVQENWAVVDRNIKACADILLTRVANKTEEVKSLRDGVSIATVAPHPCRY